MAYEEIIYGKEARIATITLNRPDKLNAMSQGLMREFDLAVEEFNHDDDARVLVIRAGRAFSAGFAIGGAPEDGGKRPQ